MRWILLPDYEHNHIRSFFSAEILMQDQEWQLPDERDLIALVILQQLIADVQIFGCHHDHV